MANARNKPKGPEIGLRQAKRLGQLNPRERLEFIARGLPLILRSAKKFREAGDVTQELRDEDVALDLFEQELDVANGSMKDSETVGQNVLPLRPGTAVV